MEKQSLSIDYQRLIRLGPVAQWIEQSPSKGKVGGSTPPRVTSLQIP